MLFRMLGVPEVYDERGNRGIRLTSSKQGTLLGALMARPGMPVHTDELVHELWGDHPPGKAGNALQAHVSRLRQTLSLLEPELAGRSRLLTNRSGYALQAHERETDAGRFRLSVARARRLAGREPQAAYHQVRQALALWRGEVLEGSARGPICAAVAADLERVREEALEAMFDAALRSGRHEQVLAELREAVRAHPEHPQFGAQLTLALHRAGPAAGPTQTGPGHAPGHGHGTVHRGAAGGPGHRPGRGEGPSGGIRAPHEARRSDELDRLRGLVQLLASEQRSLRVRLERLSALVGEGAAAS
ncbi:BTAD domain-containing putative transcriptional regulator [Streptomyces sp. NPDC001922]|uniref:AfsR/SARP family transcriptional regulator n=1 Tax=Streptomyces sp. NPDC001922 TaxID=3364624 RepID=UPI0036863F91